MENKELKKFEDKYMLKVKGGKYKPSFTDEEKEVFDIEVCKYPTTQKMWLEVMENNPSKFKGENKPVETVTWWQALEFCNKLSEKYGLEPVYNLSKSKQGILMIKELDGKIVDSEIANFKNTEGFRLPTEVEWEWFSKGGQVAIKQGTFDYIYSGSNNVDEVAWYIDNSGATIKNKLGYYNDLGSTQDVGLKKPNQLGLYDCNGNVWEWCYEKVEEVENETYRRLRGGSFNSFPEISVISYCSKFNAIDSLYYFGFRIVRTF